MKGKKTGGGSRKGKPNKTTATAKEAWQHAFDHLGGKEGLAEWAETHKDQFYAQYGKAMIPRAIEGTGADGAVTVKLIQFAGSRA